MGRDERIPTSDPHTPREQLDQPKYLSPMFPHLAGVDLLTALAPICQIQMGLGLERDQQQLIENGHIVDDAAVFDQGSIIVLVEEDGRQAGNILVDRQRRQSAALWQPVPC